MVFSPSAPNGETMDDEFEMECVDCGWQGFALDLVSKTDDVDDTDFSYCPDCGSSNVFDIVIDIEKEE